MANSIALRTEMVPMLDMVYKAGSTTSVLDYNGSLVRDGADAKTVQIAKRALQGLGDYSRGGASGFVAGDVTLTWESHTFSYDRGRSFQIDAMDTQESADQAFGALTRQFMDEYVTPEVDAIRFAEMAGTSGILTTTGANLDASTAVTAIDTAIQAMDDNEVTEQGRVLFVSPAVYNYIKNSSKFTFNLNAETGGGIDRRFAEFDGMRVVKVPQSRFLTAITLNDGTTSGQEAGGYAAAVGAKNINFMIVQRDAVAPIVKHVAPRYFTPEQNQDADAHKYQLRMYHDIFVFENKVKGIYLHKAA